MPQKEPHVKHLGERSQVAGDSGELSTIIARAITALEEPGSSVVESEPGDKKETAGTKSRDENLEGDGSGRPPAPGSVRGLWNERSD